MKALLMIFCILACVCVAAIVPVAVFFEWYCLLCVGGALVFAGLMFFIKRRMEPKPPKTTFVEGDADKK